MTRAFAALAAILGFAMVWAGCPDRKAPPRALLGSLSRGLLDLAEEARRELDLEVPERADAEQALRRILARVCPALRGLRGDEAVTRLNQLVFDELGFRREVDDRSPEFMLLPRVLATRRGSCLGLGALYLVVGEQCRLPLRGVLVPGHFFVRLAAGKRGRDIELLKRGRAMPERWYVKKYRVPEGNPTYLERDLSHRQSLAVYRYNVANELRLRGRYRRAAAEYLKALRQLPRFAEARASLGLVRQLQGDRAGAERAYRLALRDNPGIQGLRKNLEVLRGKR